MFKLSDGPSKNVLVKGWELMFLIRAFGLSEELSTEVGLAFSNNGFKSQDLRLRMKKIHDTKLSIKVINSALNYLISNKCISTYVEVYFFLK